MGCKISRKKDSLQAYQSCLERGYSQSSDNIVELMISLSTLLHLEWSLELSNAKDSSFAINSKSKLNMDQRQPNPEGKWELSVKHSALKKLRLHLQKPNVLRKSLTKDSKDQQNLQTIRLQSLIPNQSFQEEESQKEATCLLQMWPTRSQNISNAKLNKRSMSYLLISLNFRRSF